jgi:hypothetical protein
MFGEWNRNYSHINLGTIWSDSSSGLFTPGANCPQYPLSRRLGGPHSQSGRCGEEDVLHLAGNQKNAIQSVTRHYIDRAISAPYLISVLREMAVPNLNEYTRVHLHGIGARDRSEPNSSLSCNYIPVADECFIIGLRLLRISKQQRESPKVALQWTEFLSYVREVPNSKPAYIRATCVLVVISVSLFKQLQITPRPLPSTSLRKPRSNLLDIQGDC